MGAPEEFIWRRSDYGPLGHFAQITAAVIATKIAPDARQIEEWPRPVSGHLTTRFTDGDKLCAIWSHLVRARQLPSASRRLAMTPIAYTTCLT